MATINAQVRLSSTGLTPNPNFPGAQFSVAQVGTAFANSNIVTSTTAVSIPLGSVTWPRWCAFQNQDTTNDAVVSTDGTNYDWAIPAASCVLNCATTAVTALSIKAVSGAPNIVYLILQG